MGIGDKMFHHRFIHLRRSTQIYPPMAESTDLPASGGAEKTEEKTVKGKRVKREATEEK